MSVEDFIIIFVGMILICIVFGFATYKVCRIPHHKEIRVAYDTFLYLKKVLIRECCITNSAGELLDELDDKLFSLYKEVR